MNEAEYICVECGQTYAEDEPYQCSNCGENICPNCGGDIVTIKVHDEAMKEMYNEN